MSITNKKLVTQFYYAFANAKPESMVICYADNIIFKDPAFGELKGERAKNMWRFILAKNKNIKITATDIFVSENSGTAKWKAEYQYGKNKRKVTNNILATFEFKDGKIAKHTDDFNLHDWSKQALGLKGLLLGWTPYFKKKLQTEVHARLDDFSK